MVLCKLVRYTFLNINLATKGRNTYWIQTDRFFSFFLSPKTSVKMKQQMMHHLPADTYETFVVGLSTPSTSSFTCPFTGCISMSLLRRRAFIACLEPVHTRTATKAFSCSLNITGHSISSFQLLKWHQGYSCHLRCRGTLSASHPMCMESK